MNCDVTLRLEGDAEVQMWRCGDLVGNGVVVCAKLGTLAKESAEDIGLDF